MPEHADEEQHPDLVPDGFDEEFGDDLPGDVEAPDGLPVNPEAPEVVQDAVRDAVSPLPPLPSLEDGAQEEYGSYDPTEVIKTDPKASVLHDEQGNILPAFDAKHRDDFEGLLYIGALTKTFTWLGHKFRIRTLDTDENLAVGLVTQPYDQTMGAALAMKTAFAAICVLSVDGQELPIPYQADNDDAWAHQRFDYVKSKWYPFTIEAVYAEYLELESKVAAVVVAMGKARGQAASTTG